MNTVLFNGSYDTADTANIISNLFNLRSDLELSKLSQVSGDIEDLEQFEKRYLARQEEQRTVINTVRNGKRHHIRITAEIVSDAN